VGTNSGKLMWRTMAGHLRGSGDAQPHAQSTTYNILNNEKREMFPPFGNNNIGSLETRHSAWKNCIIANDLPQILAWLSPLGHKLRHQICRVENVGKWRLAGTPVMPELDPMTGLLFATELRGLSRLI